jgi:3-dehydro-4-phosphotetronate decarboxylase
VRQVAARQPAVLLANHGPVVAGSSLDAAVGAIEELEATAKLFLLLQGKGARPLGAAEVAELEARYPRS